MKYYDKTVMAVSDLYCLMPEKDDERAMRRVLKDAAETISTLPADAQKMLDIGRGVAEVRRFAKEYQNRYVELVEKCREEFAHTAESLSAGEEFTEFAFDFPVYSITSMNDGVHIAEGYHMAVMSSFVLKDGVASVKAVFPEWYELSRTDSGYLLEILDDEGAYIAIPFSDITVQRQPVNALTAGLSIDILLPMQNPWDLLSHIAAAIVEHIDCGVANEAELSIEELARYLSNDEDVTMPELFASIAEEMGAAKILYKCKKSKRRLFRSLSKSKYEPMWREVYRIIAETQQGIPNLADIKYSEAEMKSHCDFITEELRRLGYEGEYPLFHKCSELRGLRIAAAYDSIYFVGHEKDARHYILCRQRPAGEHLGFDFLCGTVLCRDTSEKTDIFSCMFDREGKSFFSYISASIISEDDYTEDYRTVIRAAAKSAELKRLTKEERQYKWSFSGTALLLPLMFLFMTLFFGLFMTVGMLIISVIITLIFTGSFAAVPDMISAVPWWQLGVLAGGLFAAVMTVIEIISLIR